MEENENEEVSIWGKKPDELTVGEQLKIVAIVNGVVLGVIVAVPVSLVAWEKFSEWRANRKQAKLELVQSDTTK